MKIKEKKNLKLILFGIIILIAIIVVAIIIYNSKKKISNETISAKSSTSNIGITTEEDANSWDTSKLSEIIIDTSMVDSETGEKTTMYVPIPAGYTASKATAEDEVVEGLVIYEGTDEVNDSNVAEAKTTRNQYVWIPVNPEDVYWTDDNGKKWGIQYTYGDTRVTQSRATREPVTYSTLFADYVIDEFMSNFNSGLELKADIESYFNEMIDSIEIYSGFYIGRYEVGDETAIRRNGNSGTTDNAVVMQGKYVYNFINWFNSYDLCKTLSRNQ